MLECFFNKIAGFKVFFKNIYFEEHLETTASASQVFLQWFSPEAKRNYF